MIKTVCQVCTRRPGGKKKRHTCAQTVRRVPKDRQGNPDVKEADAKQGQEKGLILSHTAPANFCAGAGSLWCTPITPTHSESHPSKLLTPTHTYSHHFTPTQLTPTHTGSNQFTHNSTCSRLLNQFTLVHTRPLTHTTCSHPLILITLSQTRSKPAYTRSPPLNLLIPTHTCSTVHNHST